MHALSELADGLTEDELGSTEIFLPKASHSLQQIKYHFCIAGKNAAIWLFLHYFHELPGLCNIILCYIDSILLEMYKDIEESQ